MTGARRWVLVVVPVVAVAVGLVAGLLLASGDDSTASHVAAVNVPRYAGPALSSLPGTTAPPATTALPANQDEPTQNDEVPTTPLDCLFSFDAACGDWYWDPPVAPDARTNATITVTIDPPHPVVGETVTFTVEWSDPDADQGVMSRFDDGQCADGCPGAAGATPTCPALPTGRWTPPVPIAGKGTFQRTAVYGQAGTFTWRAGVSTSSSSFAALKQGHDGCGLTDPYASGASASGTITVAPDLGEG